MSSIKERAKVLKRIKVEVGEDFIVEINHNETKVVEFVMFISDAQINWKRNSRSKVQFELEKL